MNYTELAEEIHEIARSKGFWDHARDIEEMLALAVSELAEALEEHRGGKPLIYYKHSCEDYANVEATKANCLLCTPKPEGLLVELADCMIRCFDTLYHLERHHVKDVVSLVLVSEDPSRLPALESAALFRIMQSLCKVTDKGTGISSFYLGLALLQCQAMILRYNEMGAEVVMRIKMDYNKTREHMHGKAY